MSEYYDAFKSEYSIPNETTIKYESKPKKTEPPSQDIPTIYKPGKPHRIIIKAKISHD